MEKLDKEKIKESAKWCLGCKQKPCSKACPMHTEIPEFISKINEDNFEEAYNILINNNMFSHICGLVCPQENQCEGSCVRGIKQTPTKIGFLEKSINEWAMQNKIEPQIKILKTINSENKVAIIGSGPARPFM